MPQASRPEASMLDERLHPSAGLNGIALQYAQHVIVIASNGDWHGELPLLWNLCSAWTDMSYSVAVLDATTVESDEHPGLQQLLAHERFPLGGDQDPTNWAIFPAALGLAQLGQPVHGHAPWDPIQTLGHLLDKYEIILIYASALDLANSLPDSGIEPLLPISMSRLSIVPAYQALKHLTVKGRLHTTTVAVVDTANPAQLASAHLVSKNLQACAFNFLGQRISTLTAPSHAEDGHACDDIKTLALRLLESAVPVLPDSFIVSHATPYHPDPPSTSRKH
jgi:hypothetical protein